MIKKLMFGNLGLALFALCALAAESGVEMYQRAVMLERGGNLKDAVKLYEKVASQFAKDKPLAAKAFVAAADGYRVLGDDQALKLYQRVVSDYADQPDALKNAQTRIAALKKEAEGAFEAKLVGENVYWVIQSDGRNAVYWDPTRTKLMFGDLAGKTARQVYAAKPSQIPLQTFASRDLTTVLLHLDETTWAVVKNDGTGYRELPELKVTGTDLRADFAWDNRFAVVGRALTKVNLVDGKVLQLLPAAIGGNMTVAVSPDGRYVAYGSTGPYRTLILSAEGGEPRLVSNDRAIIDWTPDGDILAQGAGGDSAYLIPMQEGQSVGRQVRVSLTPPMRPRRCWKPGNG